MSRSTRIRVQFKSFEQNYDPQLFAFDNTNIVTIGQLKESLCDRFNLPRPIELSMKSVCISCSEGIDIIHDMDRLTIRPCRTVNYGWNISNIAMINQTNEVDGAVEENGETEDEESNEDWETDEEAESEEGEEIEEEEIEEEIEEEEEDEGEESDVEGESEEEESENREQDQELQESGDEFDEVGVKIGGIVKDRIVDFITGLAVGVISNI